MTIDESSRAVFEFLQTGRFLATMAQCSIAIEVHGVGPAVTGRFGSGRLRFTSPEPDVLPDVRVWLERVGDGIRFVRGESRSGLAPCLEALVITAFGCATRPAEHELTEIVLPSIFGGRSEDGRVRVANTPLEIWRWNEVRHGAVAYATCGLAACFPASPHELFLLTDSESVRDEFAQWAASAVRNGSQFHTGDWLELDGQPSHGDFAAFLVVPPATIPWELPMNGGVGQMRALLPIHAAEIEQAKLVGVEAVAEPIIARLGSEFRPSR